jgi:hypothetical protein
VAQIFPPATNALARGTIFGAIFILAAAAWAGAAFFRSPYVTQVNVVRDQPVPFSHDHHVAGLGIDCRFCHATVETAAFAGMPSTEVCMGCHSQIWNKSPLLAPVRESFESGKPLVWTRVTDVPDFVYFNHSIHVNKGIGCESCHGRVDRMPLMRKAVAMHMQWCLDCHRHPETSVRPRDQVFRFGGERGARVGSAPEQAHDVSLPAGGETETSQRASRLAQPPKSSQDPEQLVRDYGIVKTQLTDCVICHR